MILHWIRIWEKINDKTLEEHFLEPNQNFVSVGRRATFCSGCKRWVSEGDYHNFCFEGYHEFAVEITPGEMVEPQEVHVNKLSSDSKQ